MQERLEKARKQLAEAGQAHVLRFWDRLDEEQKDSLLSQVVSLDFESIAQMCRLLEDDQDHAAAGGSMTPLPVVTLDDDAEAQALYAQGEALLRKGAVGVILVAGGQGTRLGFDGPKGAYPTGPISEAPLFEIHARKILALERTYATEVPFYIMTSRSNDEATRRFFSKHNHFGLNPERVFFFTQRMWPALSPEGKIMLDSPGHIFMSPDGHGGTLTALLDNALFEDMSRRGVESLFYFQVDNALVDIADPRFIGLHDREGADVSVKVCMKRDPQEGLGVVVDRNGVSAIVEYTELTEEQKNARLPDGSLEFGYGSVAIHVFSRAFLQRETEAGLPIHVAHKKVAYCDEKGNTIEPGQPNAYKFEKFIFDVLPHARTVINLAFAREDEFSPIKNSEGNDSPAMARRDIVRKFARWFAQGGIEVPRDADGEPACLIEIDPAYARNAQELLAKVGPGFTLTAGEEVLLR